MELLEDVVITGLLMFFTALLAVTAIAAHLWPLWLPVAMLGWATIRFWIY